MTYLPEVIRAKRERLAAKDAAASHTEGPWQSQHDFDMDGLRTIVGGIDGPDEGRMHYTVICEMNDEAEDFAANRRLIVAAPALLAALQALDAQGHTQATRAIAKRAIAAATGGRS